MVRFVRLVRLHAAGDRKGLRHLSRADAFSNGRPKVRRQRQIAILDLGRPRRRRRPSKGRDEQVIHALLPKTRNRWQRAHPFAARL